MKIAGYLFIGLLIVSAVAQAAKLLVVGLIGLILVAFIMHPKDVLYAIIFMGVLALIRDYPAGALTIGTGLLLIFALLKWLER
ncbi:hypothetical protein [Sphingopyxis yananensis]|uniref:hypothetical protein n=1 Tax=Sphingopyxis yananensis TaxID=2886687 RepID=UPI001D0F5A12|nr:hypothetical protein [Sphingopyxis yananensis]MCC2602407.1 hypothetical protein [Sphingopyxis yananensis]